MFDTQGDVGALVFCQQDFFFALGDQGRAFDHDPVLCAVVVHLQAELGARAHSDAFDLVPLAHINTVIRAPRAGDFAVLDCLRDVALVQARHHLLDLLHMAAGRNQQGVRRVDDQQVLRAQDHHRAVGRVHKGVAGLQRKALAVQTVALSVCGGEVCHSVPAADVAPGAGKGQHGHVGVVFHDGVVNAF